MNVRPLAWINCLCMLGLAVSLTTLACSPSDRSRPGDAAAAQAVLIATSKAVIEKHRLTEIPFDCLTLEISDESRPELGIVSVRELHNDRCGGDPSTAPKLFTLRIASADGTVWSDAKSLSGEFEKLP